MIEVRRTEEYTQWFGGLCDRQARARIDTPIRGLSLGNPGDIRPVIDLVTGWKIDFIIRKPRAYSREEFERRRVVALDGVVLDVVSAEDVLIAKLEWAKRGSSDRQIEDAAGILRVQGDRLDLAYVRRWVQALDLDQQWRDAQSRAV